MRLGDRGKERIGPAGVVLGMALLLLSTLPCPGDAQSGLVVQGRVVEPGGAGIQNAIVALDGARPVLTSVDGSFRLDGVERGERMLRVEAFGYRSSARMLTVDRDTAVTVVLDFAPFALDSLVVAPRRIEVDGRVRSLERDVPISGADVTTSQGHASRTNRGGGFDLTAWEAIPLLLTVRAFGYLPLDTIVEPAQDEDYLLFVERDLLVERMIATEIRRIEERAGGRLAVTMQPLGRDDLLRWNVERIEFLFRGAMLRVYTREFMRAMLGSGIELGQPTYVDMARPPFCT